MEVPEVPHRRPPHRPRRARRARRGRAHERDRRRPQALEPQPRGGAGRHPRAPLPTAGERQSSASPSPTGSTTCSPACARRSRSRSSATTSTRCARSRRTWRAARRHQGHRRPADREAGAHPAIAGAHRLRPRRQFSGCAGRRRRGSGGALQRPRRVADRRREAGASTWCCELADADRTTGALTDMLVETPAGRVPLGAVRHRAETDGPNQILREDSRRRIAVLANTDGSDMARIVGDDPRGARAEGAAAGLLHPARRPVPGSGERHAPDRRCSRCSRSP